MSNTKPDLPATGFLANFHYKPVPFEGFDSDYLSHLLKAILRHISQSIFILDENLDVIAVNEQVGKLLDYPVEVFLSDAFKFLQFELFSDKHRAVFLETEQKLKNFEPIDRYITFPNRTGKHLHLHLQIFPYHPLNAKASAKCLYIGLLTDITLQTSVKKELKKARYFDQLTGLKNRYAIDRALQDLVAPVHTEPAFANIVVVAIHIDRLYTFNQSIGREATDNLIKSFVQRIEMLKVNHCSAHTFSRLSGNDFCLILQVEQLSHAYDYLDKLSQAFELPFNIAGQKMYLRLSIGVAAFPEDAKTGEALLTHAEAAIQKARLSGGDSIVWYKDIKQMSDLFHKIHLESALAQALARQEFVPFYQPKLSFIQDDSYLFEALVRWQHPELGVLSPQEFIDTLLDAHLDQKLFENIVRAVIADIHCWKDQGFHVKVSINADVQQLINPEFLRFMQAVVTSEPTITQHLEIEITEINRIVDEKTTKATLTQLRDWGFRIALDDFGTGFASLSYLSNYQFDVVKIDQSFISDMMQNAKKQQIVKRMIDLAHDLDMQAYAEGVEQVAQHQFLAMVGCDGTQGYLYGKPMCGENTTHWLKMQVNSRLD